MRKTTVTAWVAAVLCVWAAGVSAQTISSVTYTKNAGNSPDNFQDDLVTSFQRTTTVAPTSPPASTGFQIRYAEAVGVDVGLTGGNTSNTQLSDYTIQFTVTAPQSYALDITTSAVGALTLVDDNSDPASATMSAITGTFSGGALYSGTLSLTAPGTLTGDGGGNLAFNKTSLATVVNVGLGVPQTHTLRFTWSATCTSDGTFFGGGDECAVRLGLPVTYGSESAGDYPGVGGRTQASDGHFVGVAVRTLCGNGVLNYGETCDEGVDNGASTSCCNSDCTFRAGGQVCRPAAGDCDLDDLCTGSSPLCTADAKLANGTVCRAVFGLCDLQEVCNGVSNDCPVDAVRPPGYVCRAPAGVCDLAETCSGLSHFCPLDSKSTAVCRPSAGVCDVVESCDGANNNCPADGFQAAGTSCPSDGQPCTTDVCNGSSASCTHPAGNAGTTCRPFAGPCDVDDHCNGTSTTCPADSVAGAFVVCRASGGECDLAENCNGVNITCPVDAKKSNGTPCTDDGNPCSADQCNGASDACQHPAGNAGATCRAAAGECDLTETCTGASTSCPADAKKSSGTACTSDGNVCTLDQCNGSSTACQHPAGNAGTVCRASAGECDATENCDGASTSCPADGKVAAGTACTSDANVCTLDECDGASDTCQHPAGNAGAVCRGAAGECDAAETCDGASSSCPADAKQSAGTPCTADGNVCTDDQCNGTSDVCQHPNNTAPCDDGLFCTVNDTCGGGTCTGSARDCNAVGDQCHNGVCDEGLDACVGPNKPDGTPCGDGNTCTAPDTCTAGTCGGPQDFTACVDEFQCYKVKTTSGTPKFAPILNVQLDDSFESGLFDLKKRKQLCAPADMGGLGTHDPATHLTSYQIKPSIGQPVHLKRTNITVTNAVGTLKVDTVKADYLMVPTAKSVSGPTPPAPNPTLHDVDHFKCYKVKVTRGTPAFPHGVQAQVSDQFTSPAVNYDLKKPKHLCKPVDKAGEGIKNAARHLLCYVVKPALGQPLHLRRVGLYINNQFGAARLDTLKEDELCVPSETP